MPAILGLAVLAGAPALAQESGAAPADAQDAIAPDADRAIAATAADARASRIIGRVIENEHGWQIGKVDDLLIDPEDGRVKFVVLTAGSRFEAGEGELALALPDERLRFDGKRLAWHGEPQSLSRLPWIKGALEDEDEAVRERIASGRALIGARLEDARGARFGKIKDLVVDLEGGKLSFAVADHDRSWRRAGRMVALPRLQLARREGAPGELAVSIEPEELASRPIFEDPRFPGLSESSWPQRLERLLSLD